MCVHHQQEQRPQGDRCPGIVVAVQGEPASLHTCPAPWPRTPWAPASGVCPHGETKLLPAHEAPPRPSYERAAPPDSLSGDKAPEKSRCS